MRRLSKLFSLERFRPKNANPVSSNGDAGGSSNPVPEASIVVVGGMRTDVGLRRSNNEDAVAYVMPPAGVATLDHPFLAIVADGMGGHAAGEVASAIAVDVVRERFFASREPFARRLHDALVAADAEIATYGARHEDARGLGTTCTAVVVAGAELYVAHVGDSRAYLLRDGRLLQLTEDQTLHAKLIRDGEMTAEEARGAPGSNFLLQALGTRQEIAPSVVTGARLRLGDRILVCSDGLTGLVDDTGITSLMAAPEPNDACEALVEAARTAGGHDNISVGVFEIRDPASSGHAPGAATRPDLVVDGVPSMDGCVGRET